MLHSGGKEYVEMKKKKKTREFLKSIGLPGGDAYDLPTSTRRFADGGQYRFEVPGIQGPKVMKALLEAMDSYGLYLHRVTQTQGIMRLTDEDISKMVELAHKYETDLILAIGPRATTDTSASVHHTYSDYHPEQRPKGKKDD